MKWLVGWAKGELAPPYSCVRALFNSGNGEFGLQHPDFVFETTLYNVEKQPKKLGAFPWYQLPCSRVFLGEKLHNLPPYKRKNSTFCDYAKGVKENYATIFLCATVTLAK
jgi:hypothetical protein